MKTKKAKAAFERRAGGAAAVTAMTARQALEQMLAFYADDRADDAAPFDEDGDMLLYEWGPYDFGSGPETFQLDLVRQFMLPDEDEPFQLHVTLHYAPTAELRKFKSGDQWCASPDEAGEWRQAVEKSRAFKALADAKADRVEVWFTQC